MADNKVQIVIQAVNMANGAIESARYALNSYRQTLNELNGSASQVSSSIRNMISAMVGGGIFAAAIRSGYEFNATIEDTRVGLASLIYAMNEFRDVSGKVVQGQEAFSAALRSSEEVQLRLRLAGLETAATYEQLVKAFSQAYVPAIQAGFNEKQIVDFTVAVTQAATAMRIPLDMLGEEVRSILSGTMQSRATLLKPLMDAAGLTNEKIQELIASGQLYTAVMEALRGATLGASEASKNFSVRLSNLKDAISQALGRAMNTGFEKTKSLIQDATDWIVKFNKETGEIKWNESLINSIQKLDDILSSIIAHIKELSKEIWNFTQQHPVLTEIVVKLAGLVLILEGGSLLLRGLVNVFTWLKAHAAANIAFILALFGGIVGTLKSITIEAGIASGAFATLSGTLGVVGAAAGVIGAALAGWQLGKIISELQLAGRSIGEWVQTGYAYIDKFFAHIRYFFTYIAETSNLVWTNFKNAVVLVFYEVMALLTKIPGLGAILRIFGDIEAKAAAARQSYYTSLEASRRAYDQNMAAARKSRDEQIAFADRVLESFEKQNEAARKHENIYTNSARKNMAAATEHVLKLADVNQSFDRVSDTLEKAKRRTEELNLELKKASASPQEIKLLDIEKDYQEALEKAKEYRKDIERAVREASERIAKAEADAAEKNKKRQKTDPMYGVDPKIYQELEKAKQKQRAVQEEVTKIIQMETDRRNARITELQREFDREIAEKTKSDYDRRIDDLRKWADDLIRYEKAQLNLGIITQEQYEQRRRAILDVSNQQIQKLMDEHNQAILESQTQYMLSVLDMQEKEMSAPRVDIYRKRIEALEKLLSLQEAVLGRMDREKDITAWQTQQQAITNTRSKIQETQIALKELSGTIQESVAWGLKELMRDMKSQFQMAVELVKATAQAMQQAFSDFFFDAFQGKLKSLWDYITSFLTAVQRAVANVLSQQITNAIVSGIGSLIPGASSAPSKLLSTSTITYFRVSPGLHTGGVVGEEAAFYRIVPSLAFAGAPRFHSGFAPDEYTAILKRGEGVFTPAQMRALGIMASGAAPKINVTYNVKNESDSEIQTDEPQVRFDGDAWWIDTAIRVLRAKPDVRRLFQTGGRG